MTESKLHKKTQDIELLFLKQKRELTESLKYASYIQKALLPSELMLKRYFPEHFLLYMPRDIVSGDFYWLSHKKNRLYFAIADCTGHGVPGAFLSILGISYLNQIVDRGEERKASTVLDSLREYIMKALHQTGDIDEQKDGIDMAFCIIDYETETLHFAGAFSPLYIIKNSNRLIEIPGDKMPIGVAAEEETSFKNHEIDLKDGDMVYLFSDGYVDQFGGLEGKKFKYRPFRNTLLSICNLPIEIQKKKLLEKYLVWKGKQTQLDDISIFGFRYNQNNRLK
jgi:serine phosphatase RsbU (regulator of sigma subunit)